MALNFHPAKTNIVKRAAFPLLIANVVRHFRSERTLLMGQMLPENSFYLSGDKEVSRRYVDKPGFYRLGKQIYSAALLSKKESDLKVSAISADVAAKEENESEKQLSRSLLWWLLILVFLLILLEWLLWSRIGFVRSTKKSSYGRGLLGR